jgi:cytochrome P450
MLFGQALEKDLSRAMDPGKRKKPLTEYEKGRRSREVFSRWFNKRIEQKYRDPAAGRT